MLCHLFSQFSMNRSLYSNNIQQNEIGPIQSNNTGQSCTTKQQFFYLNIKDTNCYYQSLTTS